MASVTTAGAAPAPVLPLAEISCADVPYAGCEGAILGELAQAGLPIPPGFVLGRPALAVLDGETLEDVVRDAWGLLADDGVPLVVRTSAVTETCRGHTTFVNVRGVHALLSAVWECRSSRPETAIVVQRQLPATRTGLMCTIDLATGDRTHLMIGVSGERYVVAKASLATTVRPPSGVLTDVEVHAVADLGRRIERRLHAPQKIDWEYDASGRLWILRARRVP